MQTTSCVALDQSCLSARTQPLTATGAPSQTSTIPYHTIPTDMVARCRLLAAHGPTPCLSVRTQPLTATGAPSQTSTIPWVCHRRRNQWLRLALALFCLPLMWLARVVYLLVGAAEGCGGWRGHAYPCAVTGCAVLRYGVGVVLGVMRVPYHTSYALHLFLTTPFTEGLIIKPCPLAARICCTFSPTTFSSAHLSTATSH